MTALLSILSNPSVVSVVVAGVLAGWHWVSSRTASNNSAFSHVIDAARSAASSIVTTIAPGATVDELTAKVLGATNKLLDAAGIKATSPLAAAAINAVVHDAVNTFVTKPPPSPQAVPVSASMHAALINLSQNPPAQAA